MADDSNEVVNYQGGSGVESQPRGGAGPRVTSGSMRSWRRYPVASEAMELTLHRGCEENLAIGLAYLFDGYL